MTSTRNFKKLELVQNREEKDKDRLLQAFLSGPVN
jgi:hypothetical protein